MAGERAPVSGCPGRGMESLLFIRVSDLSGIGIRGSLFQPSEGSLAAQESRSVFHDESLAALLAANNNSNNDDDSKQRAVTKSAVVVPALGCTHAFP